MSRTVYLAITLICISLGTAHAQSQEAEWRVINEITPTIVPGYQGGPNPFPQNAAVVARAAVMDFSTELEMTKAQTLARARELINSTQVFRPNLDGLEFGGYMSGLDGPRVFHQGEWMKVGDEISVPVRGAEAAYQVIAELKNLDKVSGERVEQELQSRLSSRPQLSLKIKKIEPKEVTLVSSDGEYRAEVSQGGL